MTAVHNSATSWHLSVLYHDDSAVHSIFSWTHFIGQHTMWLGMVLQEKYAILLISRNLSGLYIVGLFLECVITEGPTLRH